MDPNLAHFVCKKAESGFKKTHFLKIIFPPNGIFRVPKSLFIAHKTYTLGPAERPSGVRNGPTRAGKGSQSPTWAILTYLGLCLVQAGKFFLGKNRPKCFPRILCIISVPQEWNPQKLKIDPIDNPMDPISAHFVGILGQFGGGQKRFFLKKIFFLLQLFLLQTFFPVPKRSGTFKNPHLAP